MPEVNYLRQLKTGRIYIETPRLLERSDMVPHDPDTAKARIAALQRRLELLQERKTTKKVEPDIPKETLEDARVIADLEEKVRQEEKAVADKLIEEKIKDDTRKPPKQEEPDPEAMKAEERKKKIDADPEVQTIRGFKKKAEVLEHVLVEYGVGLDENKTIKDLKDEAEDLRIKRLFEGVK